MTTDIGDIIVTRNVAKNVKRASKKMVDASSVKRLFGEIIVRMNVAINDPIARIVKRKMENASSVNQDIGGTTVKINAVLGVKETVRVRTECVRHV